MLVGKTFWVRSSTLPHPGPASLRSALNDGPQRGEGVPQPSPALPAYKPLRTFETLAGGQQFSMWPRCARHGYGQTNRPCRWPGGCFWGRAAA